jgi:hypothetical protein
MITDERAEKAIRYLAGTDDEAAEAKVECKRCEDQVKAVEDAIFLRLEGSVELRKATARTDIEAVNARNKYYSALLKYEKLVNHRNTEERVTELWRSVNSNRRHGIT